MKKLLISMLLLMSFCAFSQNSEDLFLKGVEFYQQAQYSDAVNAFQQLYDENPDVFEVCYNLGNSYYKLNDMPSAILYYERAKRLEPNNQDVIYNLNLANNRIIDKIESVPEMFYDRWWQSVLHFFTPDGWCIAGIVLFVILCAGLVAMFVMRQLKFRKLFFWISVVAFVLFVFSFIVSFSIKRDLVRDNEGVVFAATVTAKSSPSDNSVDLFVIHRGLKVDVTDNVGEWIEIRLSNGKIGWIHKADVKII
ncbi:MAG: tetratricopeptide repeat protein [Bacteroidales bacterium]|nr:tetratricopeptide repeat protein [Bacteroidales bacterium]